MYSGPSGTVIATTPENAKALDEFEDLIKTLMGGSSANKPEMTIFYLKNAKADSVAEIVTQVFGGSSGDSGGGSLMGDLASSVIPGMGGQVVGSLLGGGGSSGSRTAGSMHITPDTRLNALIVEGTPADLDNLAELLKILDREESPEQNTIEPKPQIIAVKNTQASDLAEVVKQVYPDRLATAPAPASRRPKSLSRPWRAAGEEDAGVAEAEAGANRRNCRSCRSASTHGRTP